MVARPIHRPQAASPDIIVKSKTRKLTIAGVVYTVFLAGSASLINRDDDGKCGGKERWQVKVLTDDNADQVNNAPLLATIADMNRLNAPTVRKGKDTARLEIESRMYTIRNCRVLEAIREDDNDIHLVLWDGGKHTMIAEIPDPVCAKTKHSEFAAEFRQARNNFKRYKQSFSNYRFDVTGVLFVDEKHPKNPRGNGPNNVELHPVISFEVAGDS